MLSSSNPDPVILGKLQETLTTARSDYSRALREEQQQERNISDQQLSDLLETDPSKVH